MIDLWLKHPAGSCAFTKINQSDHELRIVETNQRTAKSRRLNIKKKQGENHFDISNPQPNQLAEIKHHDQSIVPTWPNITIN